MDPLEPPLSSPSATAAAGGRGIFQGPKTRSVLVQTDYRDSEAQTDPYAPEHVVRPGSQPELLTLASLSYGELSIKLRCIHLPSLPALHL